MLLLKVADASDNNEYALVHDVKNAGKVTEEHHFFIHELKGNLQGRPLKHYVLDGQAAEELKRHL